MKSNETTLPFSILPVEAIMDGRITMTQLRVLAAILSFRNRSTGIAFPKRSAIAARTGIAERRISSATTALVGLGWLTKQGRGGCGRSCQYEVTTPVFLTDQLRTSLTKEPETVPESVTVTESVTVPDSVTPTVPDSVTLTVPDSVTPKEQTKEQTRNRPNPKPQPKTPPLPDGIDTQAWADFTAHRREIRKPLTAMAATKNANILRELTPDQQRQSVDASIANCWTGLFPPKHNGHGHAANIETPFDRRRRINSEIEARARAHFPEMD